MSAEGLSPMREADRRRGFFLSGLQNRRLDICVIIALALVTATLYGQVIGHEFIGYDDPDYVTDNPIVQKGLSREGFTWAFTTFTLANWHPLTWLSHMLDVQLFGMNPGFHHLVSVLFHVLNTILVFWILRQTTGALWRSAIVAALFALHPLHVESVAWVSERKDVLSTFFWLLALWAYARYAKKPSVPGYLPVLSFFALGLLAKPMLITLPLVLLLLDYWPLGRLKREPARPAAAPETPQATRERRIKKRERQRREPPATPSSRGSVDWSLVLPLVYEKIPLLVLSVASGLITLYAQQKGGAVVPLSHYLLPDRVANAVVSYAAYLWKMFWPSGLIFFYPMRAYSPALVLACALLLAGMTFLSLRWALRRPWLAVGWFWYVITLLPVIGIVKVGGAAMADRYTYVALLGPFIALAWGTFDLAQALRVPRAVLATASALVVGACMLLTYNQVGTWRDGITLSRHALSVGPRNYVGQTLLASEYIHQEKFEEALTHAKAALDLNPRGEKALTNMGMIYYHTGKYAEAVETFDQVLRMNPNSPAVHEWLGRACLAAGNFEKAAAHFRHAIQPGRDNAASYSGLGETLIFQNRLEEALRYTRQAIEAQPQNAKSYNNAGYILIRQGKVDDAIAQFQNAVKLTPDYARAHSNLGSALMEKKRVDEAIDHFETAVRLEPGNQTARENLKYALAQKKKLGR
jgi:tetratricopeptide (TPR) repeat protein